MSTKGSELFEQLVNNGDKKATKFITDLKIRVSSALEEIVLVGARVRPLMIGGQRVGWVRGIPIEERAMIARWVGDTWGNCGDHVRFLLTEATSLSQEDIEDLNTVEVASLVRLVNQMTEADISLQPFVPAFTTTYTSERLWYGVRRSPVGDITLPDGFVFKPRATHELVHMWSYQSTVRDKTLAKIEQAINTASLASAFSRPKTDPKQALNKLRKSLSVDTDIPWIDAANRLKNADYAAHMDDGWGHGGNDSSLDGLMREYKGMVDGDLHERVMDSFYTQKSADDVAEELVEKAIKSNDGDVVLGSRRIVTLDDVRVREHRNNQVRTQLSNLAGDALRSADMVEEREERKQQVMRRVNKII